MPSSFKRLADTLARGIQHIDDRLHDDRGRHVLESFEPSLQLDTYTCGAQSTFMVLRWYGRARSIDAVARALGTNEHGTTTHAVVELLSARRLDVAVHERTTMRVLEDAIRSGSPAIVLLDTPRRNHFAVVYGFSRSYIRLADPSLRRSLRTLVPRSVFRKRWGAPRWVAIASAR